MDTRSLHCKHPKKMKSSTDPGKQEVFVLPPDLLKKLGISIGNINVSQVIPTDANVSSNTDIISNESIKNTPVSNCSQKPMDTSILETASLMKKSVFLSPTFVPAMTNIIPGEVEILSEKSTEDSVAVTDLAGKQSGILVPVDSTGGTELPLQMNDAQEACHKVDQAKLSFNMMVDREYAPATPNNQDCRLMSPEEKETQVVDVNKNFHENLNNVETRLDNILGESHSCISNSNIHLAVNPTVTDSTSVSFKNADTDKTVRKLSKINIISEETIPLSKLRKIKQSQSSNLKNLTPIKINSIIDTKINNENSNSGEQSTSKPIPTVSLTDSNLLHSDLILVKSDSNSNTTNLKSMQKNKYIQSNVVSLKGADTASSQRSDIVSNIIDSANITENKQNVEDTSPLIVMDQSIKGGDTNLEEESSDNESGHNIQNNINKAIGDGQLNKHRISEDNISVNVTAVNGFDKYNIHADGIGIDKCVKNNEYVNGQMDTEPDDIHIENHHSAENKQEYYVDNAEKPTTTTEMGIDKYNVTENNLKQNSSTKSTCKQVSNSESIVDNDCRVRKDTDDGISAFKTIEDKKLKNDELAKILNATKETSSSNTNIKVDKVKEIAAYLKKFSHIYTDKKKIKKDFSSDKNKKETINLNTNTIESKLCIQGVEKPGGKSVEMERTGECKILKTYTRRYPPKQSKLSTNILHKSETCDTVDASEYKLNTDNISTSCKMQEFCLCYDFGNLAYYDYDNLNEHIHFWQHNTTNCELDLIFAIYSDEAVVNNNESELEQEQKTEEKNETYNVCWNVYRNELPENVENPELKRHDYVMDELKDASTCLPLVPEQNIVPENGNNSIVAKIHDHAHMTINNSNSDIILEAVDHDMVDSVDTAESKNRDSINNIQNVEKTLNVKHNDNISSAVVTTIDNETINADLSTVEPKLTSTSVANTGSSESSNITDKVIIENADAKETSGAKTNKKFQHHESDSNATENPRDVKLDKPQTIEKIAQKRSLSGKTTPKINKDEPSNKKNIKCGLCNTLFSEMDWEDHVTNQHHLIAWKAGGSINLDNKDLLNKLKQRLKTLGELKCSICNMKTKVFNKFMEHIKNCIQQKLSNKIIDKPTRKSRTSVDANVTCGVCQRTVQSSKWIEHIGMNHAYLAWIHGEEPLNLEDEPTVWQHLQNIIRLNGKLTCYKCGLNRSRAKLYLAHIKTCNSSANFLNESSTSVDLNAASNLEDEQSTEVTTVKCGVCKQEVAKIKWIEHISKEHNYLAWQDGDTPLNLEEEEAVWNHLQQFIRQNGGLTCYKCGLKRRRVKLYLSHIETCDGTGCQGDNSFMNYSNDISLDSTTKPTDQWFEVPITNAEEKKIIKCGVCSQEVPILEWIQHIGKEHDYLAWQDGSPPLNLEDESALRVHLLDISRQTGGLICSKCEKKLKYPKTFLQHLKECTGLNVSLDSSKSNESSANSCNNPFRMKQIKTESVICGVCSNKVETAEWMDHAQNEHQYMAWIDGQPPLDFNDAAVIQKHLNDISRMLGGLLCVKCGVRRKYVKTYLQHVETCQGKVTTGELSFVMMNQDILECAICAKKVEPKDWRDHAMKEHYNIAWVVGDVPIELNNPYAVESYLKEYQHRQNKLVCKVCGISRVSYVGFYAHIITCGKTEKETEMYKSVCDICHNKYLRIYKSQHMTMHREQEYALERKLLVAKEKELKKEEPEEVIQTGRRKAAEKAKTVIEKYKDSLQDGSYHCSTCGFSSEIETELSDHVCVEDKWGDATDSDESVKLENCSDDDESDETDVDSNVSDEEQEAREEASHKKKRYSDTTSSLSKITRLPYQIKSISTYMKRSTEEFNETYLTDEDIFTQWHNCEFEEVPENEMTKYMPPIEESCKVRFDDNQDWMSFNRFESNRVKDTMVMFVGASIQCMRWAPPGVAGAKGAGVEAGGRQTQYMAVVSHRHDDVPRHAWDTRSSAHELIQIWDVGNLISSAPRFVLGIAHDYGTVWAIDWCPSGARDAPNVVPEPNKLHRLGLLAAACSNGSAYIFLIPYPSSITKEDKLFYKLKPVVELRLTSNADRKAYQATAIKWSMQKGHSNVVVGYADGTTAYYDLNGESPLLRTTENNITILHPYHDERVQNSCIEDMDMYPGRAGRAGGVVCVGSAGGAGAGALQSHVASARVLFPPHWPAALLAGDDCLVNQSINELEWWGGGRRLGGMRGAAGCAWCGRVAAAALPLLRLMRVHPCFSEVHKQVIGTIQMTPLGGKRKRQTDELAMIVEPITYSDAVKKYGIEFKQITARDRPTQQKLSAMPRDAYPERFPLSDVAAMQFCPTFKHHHKLALALHAGLIFIVTV